jgi:hypothetical protein
MGGPSVSCLFYLFADSTEVGIARRRASEQVAIPGSVSPIPLGPLEVLLMRVAIWELVATRNVLARIDLIEAPPWRLARSTTTRPQLNLYRQVVQPRSAPPPGSLAEQMLSKITAYRTSVSVAVIDWAGERWPLPLDSLVAVAMREALDHGVLLRARARTARRPNRWAVSRPVVIPTLEADVDALDALRPAFNRAYADWDSYCAHRPDENEMLEHDCRSALASLRLRSRGSGGTSG